MKKEEIAIMSIEEIEKRRDEIAIEVATAEGDALDALDDELGMIEEREHEILESRRADMAAVASGKGKVEKRKEEKTMEDFKNSKAYVDAYAKYIRTGSNRELRALLTENASEGDVPVPDIVTKTVNTAWDNTAIMSLVNQTTLKGNVRVGFELSATDAEFHTEGAAAPDEEDLKLGIVTMVPKTIKKWITISDETMDIDSGAFLQYVYKELTYRIVKKAEDALIAKIVAAPTVATETAVSVANIEPDGIDTISNAEAELSDEANNVVVVMHKKTRAYLKKLAKAANYAVDPFDGLNVVYNNKLDVLSASASTGSYMIVGDFGSGAQVNFTAGRIPTFKYDDLSLAEKDLVKVVGRLPIGMDLVACGRFCVVKKA